LSISLQEKKMNRVSLLLAGILFSFLVGFINGYIERNIWPAILCPFGPNMHFPKKFGMKSAIIGLSRAEGFISLLGDYDFFLFLSLPENGQGLRGVF
jgi:hypothetical protein